MPDREKVINGLYACTTFGENGVTDIDCKICPYNKGYMTGECWVQMNRDALALLKEQEAITIKKTKEPYGYGVYGGICPKCRNWIQSAHSFCGFCGQAVKWE